MSTQSKNRFTPAVTVIIIFGIISMMGDVVYETARSANSQYLNLLTISAAQVGLVFGIGEFLGYFLRLVAGVLSDKSGRYWLFMFLGYGMLLIVPLIGFTMNWNILVVLILMERIGKALRSPAKDTILSGVAENQVGVGFAFGLQEALDQIGAFIGPLIFTMVFYFTGKNGIAQYQLGYKALFVPFAILMIFLIYAYRRIKRDNLIPAVVKKEFYSEHLKPIFWIYTAFTFFCTLGFVNFSTVGYHLKANNLMSDGNITLLYSVAMIVDAATALFIGKAYDRLKIRTEMRTGGLLVLMAIPFITLFLPFLTLSHSTILIVIGMIVFGIVMGTHETVMRSAIADITPFNKRGTGYGVFNTSYGLALLGGAALMGLLYDMNKIGFIIAFTCGIELIAIILYFKMNNMVKNSHQVKN
ncbi:MAG: Major Facilitator Superfamily protein [Pelotomaculum sp. PtaB.Bin013]|uniref:MFS transporter n=1 Tax=Pelotomaculum isophthalicicum JI TaxID=947010 RepID=A0A9X4H408_9FIRM|nr:MFS transporter [Pelotomaculum isophthalicicum]MDF9410011.1 MFS transporter [Pelotomaculum isophthalicicum JI]OPX89883.1 MAG: Major Facilitator Superfamily protein [Pelotomaculum sp. PtaB.Bin013]